MPFSERSVASDASPRTLGGGGGAGSLSLCGLLAFGGEADGIEAVRRAHSRDGPLTERSENNFAKFPIRVWV